ncbi:MAG: hypothetical protein Q9160_006698 [Pyrenula sp. 1 TL-2023]
MPTPNPPKPITTSAPGKVLLAGGYLILDRKYQGLVFGLDARIHVHVRTGTREEGLGEGMAVLVRSPQFVDAEWRYWCEREEEGGGEGKGGWVRVRQVDERKDRILTPPQSAPRNPFVETTLTYALTYLTHLSIPVLSTPLSITILADNDYYSQPPSSSSSPSPESKSQSSAFTTFPTPLPQAHKTGLGSSAALVTALTSSLLSFFLSLHNTPLLTTPTHTSLLHNLAQASHSAAQGKVGSGFDVAAAVYGSCLYRRFSPSILSPVSEAPTTTNSSSGGGGGASAEASGFGERIHLCVSDLSPSRKWDAEILQQAVQMPQSLRLLMCDVDCGSQTPGMVKKVLKWREENAAEAEVLWAALQRGTEELGETLRGLKAREDGVVGTGGVEGEGFEALRETLLTIRSLVREMSCKSGVPIEPPVQTELIDKCCKVEGVVGGVVPGAGGYDAVALLVRNDEEVVERLRGMLEGWKSTVEEGEGANIGKVRLLGVRQEVEGVRVEEDLKKYEGWF